MRMTAKRLVLSLGFGGAMVALSACEPGSVSTGGSVYYDSMLWNDYYYGRPRPERPDRPERPVHPIAPGPGDPGFSRPPAARPPIHRPPAGGGRARGGRL